MFELSINGKVYQFNFGFGFLRDLDPTITKKIDGVTGKVEQLGVQFAIAGIIDGNVEDLVNVLAIGNKHSGGERIDRSEIEKYLENPQTNVDELFEKVLDFLEGANCTKKTVANIQKAIKEQQAKAEAENEQN